MIAFCTQECPRKEKLARATEIEAIMHLNGFVSVYQGHLEMWQMFLVIYVKYEFREDISNVNVGMIAKGFKNVIGNKGGLSIHFILKNRSFNFIATHLRHGQNN